jgi:uncharacterized protein (DUF362 family)
MDARRSGFDPSRRAVLGALATPLLTAACGRTRLPYEPSSFRRPGRSDVGIFTAPDYTRDFADLIGRGLRELGIDVRGRRVLLKPNMVEFEQGAPINTDARIVAGAAGALLRAGAREVVVGEGPGHRRDTEFLVTATGLLDALRDDRVRFVDLNQDDVAMTTLRSRFTGLGAVALPAEVLRSDFIVSMPRLKTHHWTGMTASMKNFFGVVPGAVYGWPKNILHINGIENAILDLVATIRPHLAIVDAVVGMEGDGPIMGQPKSVGCLVMGTDLVAVDATCARLMGIEPYRLVYLRAASRFLGNVSERRIQQRGERLDRFATRFELLDVWTQLREPLPLWQRLVAEATA